MYELGDRLNIWLHQGIFIYDVKIHSLQLLSQIIFLVNSLCCLLFNHTDLHIHTQSVQFIVGLVSGADTALFSHTPAATADNSRPAFPLYFNFYYFIQESRNYDPMFKHALQRENIFLGTRRSCLACFLFQNDLARKNDRTVEPVDFFTCVCVV